jgi:hypothetical protein
MFVMVSSAVEMAYNNVQVFMKLWQLKNLASIHHKSKIAI